MTMESLVMAISFPPQYSKVVKACRIIEYADPTWAYKLLYSIALVECGARFGYFHDYYDDDDPDYLLYEYTRIFAPRLTWWQCSRCFWNLTPGGVKQTSLIGERLGFLTPFPDDLPTDGRMILLLDIRMFPVDCPPDEYIDVDTEFVDLKMLGENGTLKLRNHIGHMVTTIRKNFGNFPIELSLFWNKNLKFHRPVMRPLPTDLASLWKDFDLQHSSREDDSMIDDPNPSDDIVKKLRHYARIYGKLDNPSADDETTKKIRRYARIYKKKIKNGTIVA